MKTLELDAAEFLLVRQALAYSASECRQIVENPTTKFPAKAVFKEKQKILEDIIKRLNT